MQEIPATDSSSDGPWVALALKDGSRVLSQGCGDRLPFTGNASLQEKLRSARVIPELHFVPYGLRSNRGGRGQMRVGLRKYTP